MTRPFFLRLGLLTQLFTVICLPTLAAQHSQPTVLIPWGAQFELDTIGVQDAEPRLEQEGDSSVLQIATGIGADWPGITITAPGDHWDLTSYAKIALDVKNLGSRSVTVYCRVDSPGCGDKGCSMTGNVTLQPGDKKELTVQLSRQLPAELAPKLFGMRGYPDGTKEDGLDPSHITQLIIFVSKPKHDHLFQLSSIRAQGSYEQSAWPTMSPEEFFPMIDRFGQFMHKEWPGKTHSTAGLQQDADDDREDLIAHPGPTGWNQFGGWNDGPQKEATGYFYPTQHGGVWWLVDPEGRLFWSHGVDCVGYSQGTTPISDREFYFAELPANDSPLARFFGKGSWAPHGYYRDKGTYRTFCFSGANLMRKYGDDWYNRAADVTHKRLRSWSMNTIGNWSDSGVYRRRKTPYVVATGSGGAKPIEGSSGYWGKFPDPFDPSFRQALDRRMRQEAGKSAGDPWCIGYFVDNELAWGDARSLATAALTSPPTQAAKQVFLADLKEKYEKIEKLNAVWSTSHRSWLALAENRVPPDEGNAKEDLETFYSKTAEEYFRHCRDAVRQVAPNNLYLGCRFAWVNPRGAQAAAKYCDVIAYNLYRNDVADFELPEGLDMPVIVGEFHFGALDRGMFHTGLRPTDSQADRAEAYRKYVLGALGNSHFVGVHWFQFGDQATTGRGDGENYQIGLVDICDKPYHETIESVRDVGRSMYRTRFAAGAPQPEADLGQRDAEPPRRIRTAEPSGG